MQAAEPWMPLTSAGKPIYLDGHSTTPLAPEAFDAMLPWWSAQVGNPNSPHLAGQQADAAVEDARSALAMLVGADPHELVFTSGATEANNIAIVGVAAAAERVHSKRRKIVVSAIEHKSVLEAARSLERSGFEVVEAPVTRDGILDMEAFSRVVTDEVLLISVMAVNNELGTIQPISQVVELARSVGALIHVDCAQAVGKVHLDVSDYDFASLSSHKMYGPPGVGTLFVSAAAQLRPQPIGFGGGQELGIRPGTLPTPLIVGFGAAARLTLQRLPADRANSTQLASAFLQQLSARQIKYSENTKDEFRVPGSLSLRFPGQDAMAMIGRISNSLSISESSACNSGQIDYSHVLRACGFTSTEASETLRMFFSRYNSISDVAVAVDVLGSALMD